MTLPISARRSSTKALSLATSSLSARTSCIFFLSSDQPLLTRQTRRRQLTILGYSAGGEESGHGRPREQSSVHPQGPAEGRLGEPSAQNRPCSEPEPEPEPGPRAARLDEMDGDRQRPESDDSGQEAGLVPGAAQPVRRKAPEVTLDD